MLVTLVGKVPVLRGNVLSFGKNGYLDVASHSKRSFSTAKRSLVRDMDTPKKETRIPSVFDKEQRKWVPATWKPELANTKAQRLKVLTWNLWFDESQYDERVKHQFAIMKQLDADIVSLQEVLPLYLQKLSTEEWVRNNYYMSEFDGTQIRSYDTVLMSKIPLKQLNVHMIHSYMSRKLYVGETELNNEPTGIATVHLESLTKNSKIRKDQLGQIFTILKNTNNIFFFGDFNFCASIGEDPEFDPRFKDTWPTLKGNEFQPTIGVNYPRAEVKPARVDRIYLNSPSWVPVDVQLIGTNKIRQTVMKSIYPSDHLGVLGIFEYRPSANASAASSSSTNSSAAQSTTTPSAASSSPTNSTAAQSTTTPSASTPTPQNANPTTAPAGQKS